MSGTTPSSVALPRIHRPPMVGDEVWSARGNWFLMGRHFKSGAFADVFECTDYWSNRLVAKVLKPQGSYEQDWARADAEAVKLFELRHPCVTYVYDAFVHNDAFYIITERCEDDLSDFLKTLNQPAGYLPHVASHVLQALHYLHSRGVRHCDLHAGNVLRSIQRDAIIPDQQEAWTFKVGDFGISKLAHEVTGVETTFKNAIRPPECMYPGEFGLADHRVDVYQAALLFLEILTGAPSNYTNDQILTAAPRLRAESLQSPIGDVLSRALRRHSADRTPSAMTFWDELCEIGWSPRRV